MKMAFSASQIAFVGIELKDMYMSAGTWPVDAKDVEPEVYQRFSGSPPDGKILGASDDGDPCWVDLPPLELGQAKEIKRAEIVRASSLSVQQYVDEYPAFEVATWAVQESEAIAWLRDSNAATPFCDVLADERGISREDLMNRVVRKAEEFRAVSAVMAGRRQRLFDDIDAVEEGPNAALALAAIAWPVDLRLAKVRQSPV
ncbi:hypothetical protein [Achromobacter sp. PAB15]|uniref:hypothetical protein n=1 Tax=Achromobacter sp. PAB15 TaxID=3233048 RepID=UPI003F907B9B